MKIPGLRWMTSLGFAIALTGCNDGANNTSQPTASTKESAGASEVKKVTVGYLPNVWQTSNSQAQIIPLVRQCWSQARLRHRFPSRDFA